MVRCFFCFLFFFNLLFSQNLAESFSNICSNHGIVGGTLITYSFGDYTISNYGLSEINKSKKIDDNTQFKVASISKMIVAIAALYYGGINTETKHFCNGKVALGERLYHCWKTNGHGSMNVEQAIKESCDVFFYEISKKIGIDKIAKVAKDFGLGKIFLIIGDAKE